jgi:transcription elongation GreA/GreB family factor
MPLQKRVVVHQLSELLKERLLASNEAITTTRAAFTSDTKSSAGDKHEVGRAMVQQELDKLEAQRAKLLQLQQELKQMPVECRSDRIGFGSLVVTDQGSFLIGISFGAVEVESQVVYAISLTSPMGQALKGQEAGATVHVQGRSHVVVDVL